MTIDPFEVHRILEHIATTHPEYRVQPCDPRYEDGRDKYMFSSHHFVSHYRALHQGDYANLLVRCMHSSIGQDRSAHGQIASCLGRYAKHHVSIRPIGRRVSRDVHDNIVRPMWWVWTRS